MIQDPYAAFARPVSSDEDDPYAAFARPVQEASRPVPQPQLERPGPSSYATFGPEVDPALRDPNDPNDLRGLERPVPQMDDLNVWGRRGGRGLQIWDDMTPEERAAIQPGDDVLLPDGRSVSAAGSPYSNPEAARSGQHAGGNLYTQVPGIGDAIGAFATAANEQLPFGDEISAATVGALSGMGYDDAREAQMFLRDRLNQTNRGSRIAGGVTGAVAPAFALPGAGWVNSAQGAGKVGRAATLGAGYGGAYGFTNTDGDLQDRGVGAAVGGGAGLMTGGALQFGANALSRSGVNAAANPSPQRQLSQMGVELTPGQMLGGAWNRIESGFDHLPIMGDAIRNARRRGLESMNVAAYNDMLEPIGKKLPRGVSGREAYGMAEDLVGQAYENALGGVVVNPANGFEQAIQSVRSKPLPGAIQDTITGVVDDFANRFSQPLSGREFKQLDSEVGAAIRSAQSGAASDPSKRLVADRLSEIRDGLSASLQAADPFAAADKAAADAAFARLVRLRDAQQSLGTAAREDGIFTASDLNRAVRNADSSAGNRRYARGEALGQRLSELSAQVLPSRVPDSGSPLRSLANVAGIGGGATALGAVDPLWMGGAAAGLVAGGAPYGRSAQGALNKAYRAHAPGSARRASGGLFGRAAPRAAALEQGVLQWLLNHSRDDQALLPAR